MQQLVLHYAYMHASFQRISLREIDLMCSFTTNESAYQLHSITKVLLLFDRSRMFFLH